LRRFLIFVPLAIRIGQLVRSENEDYAVPRLRAESACRDTIVCTAS
jgi:hypothetical protein